MSKTVQATSPYNVESKIAIPSPYRRGIFQKAKKASKKTPTVSLAFPFKSMKKGDSFLIAAPTYDVARYAQRRSSWYAIRHSEATGYKAEYTTRLVENGVRVFRVK